MKAKDTEVIRRQRHKSSEIKPNPVDHHYSRPRKTCIAFTKHIAANKHGKTGWLSTSQIIKWHCVKSTPNESSNKALLISTVITMPFSVAEFNVPTPEETETRTRSLSWHSQHCTWVDTAATLEHPSGSARLWTQQPSALSPDPVTVYSRVHCTSACVLYSRDVYFNFTLYQTMSQNMLSKNVIMSKLAQCIN